MFWCKLGLFPALKKSLFGELSHTVLSCPIKMRSVLTVCVFCTVSSKEVAILKTKFTYQGPSHRSPPPTLPRSPLTRLLLWGAADAEIKGHSFENPEQTTVLLLKPGVTRSEHSHSCFAHCHECLVLSSTFSRLFFIFKLIFFFCGSSSRSVLLYVHRDLRTIRDGGPRTSTSTFAQLQSS